MDEQGERKPPRARNECVPQKTLWMYVKEGIERANARRPMSFYLLLSIPVVLLLAYSLFASRNSPRQFVFYLSLLFLFFFVILHRALVDSIDIVRKHLREHESIFGALGEKAQEHGNGGIDENEQHRS